MTTRVWTREELDRVHPLPEGWTWALWDRGASCVALCSDRPMWVSCVDGHVRGVLNDKISAAPADVAIAVALASKGLDSLGEMAAELDKRRDQALRETFDYAARGELDMSSTCDGEANSYHEAAAILRRGRVQP